MQLSQRAYAINDQEVLLCKHAQRHRSEFSPPPGPRKNLPNLHLPTNRDRGGRAGPQELSLRVLAGRAPAALLTTKNFSKVG